MVNVNAMRAVYRGEGTRSPLKQCISVPCNENRARRACAQFSAGASEPKIQVAKRIFVFVSGAFGFFLGVLLGQCGLVPVLPRNFGVVGGGQGFSGPNCGDPFVNGVFVGKAQCIEIRDVHNSRR